MDSRVLFVLTVLVLFLATKRGYCDEPVVKDIPSGDDKIVVVREGDKAPFTGQLFDPATALRWSNWLLQYKMHVQTDAEMQKKICEADKALDAKKLVIEHEKDVTVIDEYKRQVLTRDNKLLELEQRVDNPPFYKTFWFGAVTGFVLTGALVGAGVYIGTR